MAQGDFKHISVTAAEEDDVIISAGIVPRSEGPSSVSGDEAASEPEPELEPEPGPESGRGSKAANPAEEEALPDQEPETAKATPGNGSARSARSAAKDGYRETTLEDLKGEPMPLKQKIVIIAALVCIIGALAYYFIFLR